MNAAPSTDDLRALRRILVDERTMMEEWAIDDDGQYLSLAKDDTLAMAIYDSDEDTTASIRTLSVESSPPPLPQDERCRMASEMLDYDRSAAFDVVIFHSTPRGDSFSVAGGTTHSSEGVPPQRMGRQLRRGSMRSRKLRQRSAVVQFVSSNPMEELSHLQRATRREVERVESYGRQLIVDLCHVDLLLEHPHDPAAFHLTVGWRTGSRPQRSDSHVTSLMTSLMELNSDAPSPS